MRRPRRLLVTATTAGVALLLAGCVTGSTTEPTQTASPELQQPTPSASRTTPTPEPTPLVRPAAMATNDQAGAVAAAEYFLSDVYEYVYRTADTAEWSALAADDCSFCNSVLSDVEQMKAANHVDTGSVVEVVTSRGSAINAGESYSVWVTVSQGPSERRGADGDLVAEDAGGTYELFLAVWWIDGWVIRGVDVLSGGGESS